MQVSLKNKAPGWLDEINSWLEKNTQDRHGGTVLGVPVYLNREWIRVDDATIDVETGDTSITASIYYRTGANAAIFVEGLVDASVNYNVITKVLSKAVLKKATAAGEIKIDIKTIKEVLEGNWSAALNLIPNGGKVVRKIDSEYDDRRNWFMSKYGAANVYFASSDFVRWAGPATAAKYVVALVASGGGAAGAIITEVKAEIRKEFLHIVAWLQATGAANFQSIAQDFIDGKQIVTPELKLFWQQVKYSSTVFVAGQPLYTTPKLKHAAFVLVWDKTGTANITYDTVDDRVAAADNALRSKWSIGLRYALGPTGSRVVFVTPNGPADKAGLKVNDVLLKADGRSVGVSDNTTDLLAQSLSQAVDGNLTLDVLTPPSSNSVIQVKLAPAS